MRLKNYPRTPSLERENVFLTDSIETGVKTISTNLLATQLLKYIDQNSLYAWYDEMRISVEDRRKVYRGKNLGDQVTSLQQARIRNGSFTDLFIGDYWVINGERYTIVDFDRYLDAYTNSVEATVFTDHHLTLFENLSEYKAKLFLEEDVPDNAYLNNNVRTLMSQRDAHYEVIFGNGTIPEIGILLPTGLDANKKVSGVQWIQVKTFLPSIHSIYPNLAYLTEIDRPLVFESKPIPWFKLRSTWFRSMFFRDIGSASSPLTKGKILTITSRCVKADSPNKEYRYCPLINIRYG